MSINLIIKMVQINIKRNEKNINNSATAYIEENFLFLFLFQVIKEGIITFINYRIAILI